MKRFQVNCDNCGCADAEAMFSVVLHWETYRRLSDDGAAEYTGPDAGEARKFDLCPGCLLGLLPFRVLDAAEVVPSYRELSECLADIRAVVGVPDD